MLLLFATNGTVLVLSQASSAYKIKTVYNLLPLIGGVDDDMVQYTKVFKLSERLRMFLVLCTEGMLIYQLDEEESDGQSSGVINKMYSAQDSYDAKKNNGMAPPLDLGDTNIFQNDISPLKGDETFSRMEGTDSFSLTQNPVVKEIEQEERKRQQL